MRRSEKKRWALAPSGKLAAFCSAVKDIPALQSGFDGPAGKRAARSARGTTACMRASASSTARAFSGSGRGTT
ncbi:MAG TPA: hypothetical protein VHM25_04315, partial [Polyangiaceae bacterium]|nr:hypothetical protein [Polyangiaceae bacterium]